MHLLTCPSRVSRHGRRVAVVAPTRQPSRAGACGRAHRRAADAGMDGPSLLLLVLSMVLCTRQLTVMRVSGRATAGRAPSSGADATKDC